MTTDDALLRNLLDQAADLPPNRRETFLTEACAHTPELRTRIESLLAELDLADQFLTDPTISPASIPASPVPLPHIDRYQLLEPLGEGGMGTVYRARQLSPVRREVALKLIKPGMDTSRVIARFESERQALALMDHPSIAKVLDAGATDTGLPFFVMELVHGTPVTHYCDSHRLPIPQRLALFVQVCHAVQHAHQKGIIHRDLKPGNVLVTLQDETPVPKVIDFGIAKATTPHPDDINHTHLTELSHPPGTPMYMPPEQFEHHALNADTRADVYALGVLLYQLLTGLPPFDESLLDRAPRHQLHHIITTQSPPRPSSRLRDAAPDAAAELSSLRAENPRSLQSALHGDLDWIVMRCLEKDPSRRYETADALARDIQRHLRHEPVEAGPPSNLYLLQKFVRRHRPAIAATIAAALLLALATAATIASLWQSARASRARAEQFRLQQIADAESQRRQSEMIRADQVAQVLRHLIHSAQPTNGSTGRDLRVTDLLKNASFAATAYLRALPETEIPVRLELASAFADADDPDDAKENLLRAYHLATAFATTTTPDSSAPDSSRTAVRVAAQLAYYTDDLPFARRTYQQATVLFGPSDPVTHRAAHSLAHQLTQPTPATASPENLHEAIQISRALVSQLQSLDPSKSRPEHYQYINQFAQLLNAAHDYSQSETLVQQALTSGDRSAQLRDSTRAALNLTLIQSLQSQNRLPAALDLARKSLDFARATIGSSNPTTTQTQQAYTTLLTATPH